MNLKPNHPNLTYGIIVTISAYLCFAIVSAFVRSLSLTLPVIEILFFQFFISLLIIIPYVVKRKKYSLKTTYTSIHIIRDISGILSYFCYFFAIKQMNLMDATVLAYTTPFFTPFIWKIWTKEKIDKSIWWAIILGFIGIAFILKPEETIFHPGAFIGIFAGIFTALSLVGIKILNQKQECLVRTLFYFFLIGTLLSFPFSLIQWQTPNLYEGIFLLIIGILTAIGQLFLTIAYRHGTASFLSPLCYSMVIFTGLISCIIFKYPPTILSIIGALLVIIGGTLSLVIKTKKIKKDKNNLNVEEVEN